MSQNPITRLARQKIRGAWLAWNPTVFGTQSLTVFGQDRAKAKWQLIKGILSVLQVVLGPYGTPPVVSAQMTD